MVVVLGLVGGLLVVFVCPFGCLGVCFWWSFDVLLVVLLCPFGSLVWSFWFLLGSFWWSCWLSCVLEKATQGKKEPRHHNFHDHEDMTSGQVVWTLTTFLLKSNMRSGWQRSTLQNFSGSLLKEPILERIFAPTIPGDLIFQFKSGKGLGCGV